MSDLISRQAAIKYLMDNMNWYDEDGYESDEDYKRECITELINGVPSAEPVRHGKWIKTDESDEFYGRLYRCSSCNTFVIGDMDNYCPFCGSRMDEE